jgi:hypothetical protein
MYAYFYVDKYPFILIRLDVYSVLICHKDHSIPLFLIYKLNNFVVNPISKLSNKKMEILSGIIVVGQG